MKKKLQLKKLTIAKVNDLKFIKGGSGICGSTNNCVPTTDPPFCPSPTQDSKVDC